MFLNYSVRHWEEPFDSPLYCIETDGDNAIAVGTARHGMVRLWDKRKTEPVQVGLPHFLICTRFLYLY